MRKNKKIIIGIAISMAILVSCSLNFTNISAGDSAGNSRPQYTVDQINDLYAKGEWNNKVVFNSITDSVIGSEFDFVGAREDTGINAGANNVWNGRDIVAEDGKTYLVRMYVHNNGKSEENWRKTGVGVARDTHVFFSIPQGFGTSIGVYGFIDSSNATPDEYWDGVAFKSVNGEQFYLEYVPGSAKIENNGYAKGGGKALSDDIVMKKEGTLIGYDGPDGNVPGGYDNYVSIEVKAVYNTTYTLQESVRLAGTTGKNWTDNLDVKIGDELEYQIYYENKGNVNQYNVMLRDVLPNNVEYIPGSTKFWNATYTGATATTDNLVNEKGINIGSYAPGANAYVRFRAKVVNKTLAEGPNTLVSWAHGTVDNIVLQDYATVEVVNNQKTLSIMSTIIILGITCLIVVAQLFNKILKSRTYSHLVKK